MFYEGRHPLHPSSSPFRTQLLSKHYDFLNSQHGVATHQQLLARGLTRSQVRTLVTRGELLPVYRRVLRHAAVRPTFDQSVFAALLEIGPPVVASSFTAAELWGFPFEYRTNGLYVTIPQTRNILLKGVEIARRSSYPESCSVLRRGIAVTNASLTIVELADRMSWLWIEKTMDYALRNKLTTIGELRRCARFLEMTCKKKFVAANKLLASRDEDSEKVESALEQRVLNWIKRARLPKPSLQERLSIDGIRKRVDFAYVEAKVLIEVDGYAFHNDRTGFDADREMDFRFMAAGWVVIRVTSRTEYQTFVVQLAEVLRQRGFLGRRPSK